ncbi:MAG: hypothetical protein Hyperionvirus4_11 [Hyperionvirus sp.]|uniref:Uncharacterized protein n=1 Tax=Hyperionvirus sp. TaxID=2487770 RepID=A0A3G5A722_9VIRU|nr:MAG: hypothetical protein Hyperionvirus4_11 [Hyperionvirus sp.]
MIFGPNLCAAGFLTKLAKLLERIGRREIVRIVRIAEGAGMLRRTVANERENLLTDRGDKILAQSRNI